MNTNVYVLGGGVATKCIDGYKIISGCPQVNLLSPFHGDSRIKMLLSSDNVSESFGHRQNIESTSSIPATSSDINTGVVTDVNTGITFISEEVYRCNKDLWKKQQHQEENNLKKWEIKIVFTGFRNTKKKLIVDEVFEFFVNGSRPETYKQVLNPPDNVFRGVRRCHFESIETTLSCKSCPNRKANFTNVVEKCNVVLESADTNHTSLIDDNTSSYNKIGDLENDNFSPRQTCALKLRSRRTFAFHALISFDHDVIVVNHLNEVHTCQPKLAGKSSRWCQISIMSCANNSFYNPRLARCRQPTAVVLITDGKQQNGAKLASSCFNQLRRPTLREGFKFKKYEHMMFGVGDSSYSATSLTMPSLRKTRDVDGLSYMSVVEKMLAETRLDLPYCDGKVEFTLCMYTSRQTFRVRRLAMLASRTLSAVKSLFDVCTTVSLPTLPPDVSGPPSERMTTSTATTPFISSTTESQLSTPLTTVSDLDHLRDFDHDQAHSDVGLGHQVATSRAPQSPSLVLLFEFMIAGCVVLTIFQVVQ